MLTILHSGLAALWRRHREKVLVATLLRLDDHLLADAGFRRDQLQPDGLRALDLPPRVRPSPRHVSGHPARAIRPSLQGCG